MPGNRQIFSDAIDAADHFRWDSQWAEAAREYQRALSEFPDDATARSGLGFCYMQTKQWQKALAEYEYTLKRDASNIIALSKTAELYGILNRRDDAYKAYLHLADLYSQAGQGARAEAAWQKAIQLSPGSPEPHERLAVYYFEKKEIAQMIQERLAAAQGYLVRNELGYARMQCEEALRADGGNRQAQQLLAQILEGQEGGQRSPGDSPQQEARPTFSAEQMGYVGHEGHVGSEMPTGNGPSVPQSASGSLAFTDSAISGNLSGGNTSIMGNMGSAGNYGGVGNSGPSMATANGGMGAAPRKRITASQVTGVLKQAQTFQTQGRFNDAIDLCEQILESGFDRPDARYFLGWLYQEQQRWDEAIRQFQMLLNDPDYALSCYYALGQCYRARGDLQTATVHFDEAVDRVNLDALTVEESDQLVQLCQEAAEAHRMLGEQEQALTVYNALLGFLRSRGWNDKVAQVEFMLQQAQNAPAPRPTPPPVQHPAQAQQQQPHYMAQPAQTSLSEAATMAFNVNSMLPAQQQPMQPAAQASPVENTADASGDLPDWLTGILSDADKTQLANKSAAPAHQAAPTQVPQAPQAPQPLAQAPITNPPPIEVKPPSAPLPAASPTWLTDDIKPANATRVPPAPQQPAPVVPPAPAVAASVPVVPPSVQSAPPVQEAPAAPVQPEPPILSVPAPVAQPVVASVSNAAPPAKPGLEDLLNQIAGNNNKDESLKQVADAVLASTVHLPENTRLQVVRSMQDIQNYINHGLLTSAIEECLHVIDIAPQYLDVHQVLCEIYVRQGKIEQAITKYAILVDTYIVNGRTEDAIATYRRILQLEPNNITYRMRLINLLTTQGSKEDLLRERTQAAESYLRLGYMDRALTELEQALSESPTSVATRLNYALALQKLGRTQQATAEYQRVLQVDPRNLIALLRLHITMITGTGTARATALETLHRIRWQLRGEGQKNYETVAREYTQAAENYPNNADVQFSLGQIHQQSGFYDKAIDAYDLAMRDSVVDVLARTSAAQCMLAQGKPEAAINQLELALQTVRRLQPPLDPSIWAARPREEGEEHQAPEVEISLLLAKAYERTGRHEQQQTILRQIRQARPAHDEVASTLAEISARQGDMETTLQEYLDLVRHYRTSRQTDSALSVLNEMVRLAPQDIRAHSELADIYISRGMLDEGIGELRLLADIQLRRNQLEQAGFTIQRIGNVYANAGNDEEALSNLKRAAELNSSSMDLLREVVGFCLQLGRSKDAAQYQAIIARHYFDTQQVKESVAALQQLITIDRSNYEAYDLLGQTYQSVGEYEQASRVYKNLARLKPDSEIARERLATLQELRTK